MSIFYLPDLGEGLPDAEIHEWHVKEGDEVKVDQPLVSMETAKAVVDVPAPQSGRILKLFGKVGDIIKTGAPLMEFVDATKNTEATKATLKGDTGTVVGNIEVGEKTVEETARIGGQRSTTAGSRIQATPAVRTLAQHLGIDLAEVVGSGPRGSITLADVQQAATSQTHATSSFPSTVSPALGERSAPEGFEALRGTRRTMAQAMAQSHRDVVPVTLVDDADISAWENRNNITTRIIRAILCACVAEPALNAWFDTSSASRRLWPQVNLGIAMDSPEGLFVPVIKHAEQQDASQWREKIDEFKVQVRERNIPSDALKDATITLSNFGNFAGRYATPIVVPPMVAIIGTGKVHEEFTLVEGTPQQRPVLPISLTFDHRAATGGEAARFLKALLEDLERDS